MRASCYATISMAFAANTSNKAERSRLSFCADRDVFEEEMSAFLRRGSCTHADFVAMLKRADAEETVGAESESSDGTSRYNALGVVHGFGRVSHL